MIVLSLFDGMACGRVALERAGIKVDKYYASEIHKQSIVVAQKNYSDIIQLGDVNNYKEWGIEKPDLIIAGSPCQGFSFAGKQLAFNDPRSVLFWRFVDTLEYFKPKYFLLENVRMKQEYLDIITEALGVEPTLIDSNLVSAQNRKRYYWTNIKYNKEIEDKNIVIDDIIDADSAEKAVIHKLNENKFYKGISENENGYRPHHGLPKKSSIRGIGRIPKSHRKQVTLNTFSPSIVAVNDDVNDLLYRKLSCIECERLQTLDDDYTSSVSDAQRYRMLGNGWTVDIIAHIFKGLRNDSNIV